MSEDPTREISRPGRVPRLSLAVARGADAGRLVEIDGRIGVGTADGNELVLRDTAVSRYHLEVAPAMDGVAIRDLGSTNGTFVGAVRLRDATIPTKSQIRIGETLLVVDATGAAAEPNEAVEIPGMVFASESMQELARQIRLVAAGAISVLVEGETGTGKELVAKAIHALAGRGGFVVVDCASLPASLVEAELFGHERGAFTGAVRERSGAFERAHGGTLFLDEIGELPPTAQASLLGVLERRVVRRVGGDREIPVDVRVICATNRDLRKEVNRGTFRADLFYRIAGARLVVPPLRERPDDIPLLVAHFAEKLTGSRDVPIALGDAHWSGNVRELRNAVERAIVLGSSPDAGVPRTTAVDGDDPIESYRDAKARAITEFERSYLGSVIARCGGNASEAARRARMDRPYLLSLLRRYGLR